ncbi:MAG: hypothetical protein K9K67_03835 [Bacteriovoracaceae bacterium]|nr:hypothetical protein [Bacteriovoracaceae bacterium]
MLKTMALILLATTSASGNSVFDHISANKLQISSSRCQNTSYLDNKDHFESVINSVKERDQLKTASIGGLLVEEESVKLTAAYRYLTSHLDYKLRPAKDIDYWHLFKDGQCKDVVCAAKEVFGPETGSFYMGLLLETGLNLSALGYSLLKPPIFQGETEASANTIADFNGLYRVRAWQEEELQGYLEGIYSLPSSLYPLPPTRLAQSTHEHRRGPQVHSNATIIMYPAMLELEKEYQKYTMVHEIGHVIASHFGLDTNPLWFEISWQIDRERNQVLRKNETSFVSAYARQDIFEDFAESFAAFRFNPKSLLAHSPEKFNFIKERVFKGQDYLSESECPQ